MAPSQQEITYYARESGQLCRERVLGNSAIRWAYQTLSGKMLSPLLFGSSILSRLLGCYFDSPLSRRKVAQTITDLDIDPSEFAQPSDTFRTFNEFFTRELKKGVRPFSRDPDDLLSPAEGRLLAYTNITSDSLLQIKGIEASLQDLFRRDMAAFSNGTAVVIRLCPADYHRYHFPCDATVLEQTALRGQYHSVNPLALQSRRRIFCRNKRSYTLLDTERFGPMAFMEVGAFGVAGIHQTFTGNTAERMQEKGFFSFGGSTIILILQEGYVQFADDLIEHSHEGVETLVKVGETIGHKLHLA